MPAVAVVAGLPVISTATSVVLPLELPEDELLLEEDPVEAGVEVEEDPVEAGVEVEEDPVPVEVLVVGVDDETEEEPELVVLAVVLDEPDVAEVAAPVAVPVPDTPTSSQAARASEQQATTARKRT